VLLLLLRTWAQDFDREFLRVDSERLPEVVGYAPLILSGTEILRDDLRILTAAEAKHAMREALHLGASFLEAVCASGIRANSNF
jgi:hypothetical protein